MIPEFVRCLKECQPPAFIMENVPGLMQKKTRSYFDSVLAQLSACGYRLNWAVLNSVDYGVPQKRKRLFILGAKSMQLRFPCATHGPSTENSYLSAFDVIGNEPIGEAPNCPVKFARFPISAPLPMLVTYTTGRASNRPCRTLPYDLSVGWWIQDSLV